jgi:hypothetical protein
MEDHAQALLPLELRILAAAESDATIIDLHIQDAIRLVARRYHLEREGAAFRLPKRLDPRVEQIFREVETLCEWHLRRTAAPPPTWPVSADWEGVGIDALVAALRRLAKSIGIWNERGGRRGYVDYIREFLPRSG